MKDETFHYQGEEGLPIFTCQWLPEEGQPLKGIVQIAHGMAEHAQRYARFAQTLVEAGFGVYANDHRGHGQTAGSLENIGYLADEAGWEKTVADMHRLSAIVREKHPTPPLFLLGHSFGSMLSRDYICQYGEELQGVLLGGTAGDPGIMGSLGRLITKMEIMRIGKKGRSPLLRQLVFGHYNRKFKPNRTEFDWLSSDPVEVDKHQADPYCGTIFSAGFFQEMLWGLQQIHRQENLQKISKHLPIYLFSGALDPVGNYTKGLLEVYHALREVGIEEVRYKIYPKGRHEMLNEINREEVFQDIIRWLKEHL